MRVRAHMCMRMRGYRLSWVCCVRVDVCGRVGVRVRHVKNSTLMAIAMQHPATHGDNLCPHVACGRGHAGAGENERRAPRDEVGGEGMREGGRAGGQEARRAKTFDVVNDTSLGCTRIKIQDTHANMRAK